MQVQARDTARAVMKSLDAIAVDLIRDKYLLAQDELATILAKLVFAASLVQETLNASCRVNELPPEILVHIFSFVPALAGSASTRAIRSGYSSSITPMATYDLLPLTHVCRHWRGAALAAPALWATVYEPASRHCEAVTPVLLARAKHAQLAVHVDRPTPSAALCSALATRSGTVSFRHPDVAARIVRLDVRDARTLTPLELAAQLLAFPAPRLACAVIRRHIEGATPSTPPMVELFSGTAPCLTSLTLHNLPFLPANTFPSLRAFELSFDAAIACWTTSDLVQTLARMPTLEELRLLGVHSPAFIHRGDATGDTAAQLPRLRTLDIQRRSDGNPTAFARDLLARVALPAACSVRLRAIPAHRLTPSTDLNVPVSSVGAFTQLAITVTFTAINLIVSSPHSHGSMTLELETAGAKQDHLQQCVEAFVTSGPAAATRTVTVESQRAWKTWCDARVLLSYLRHATELTVKDAALVDDLLDALRVIPTAPLPPIPGPRLEMLRLPPMTNSSIEKLRSALAVRSAYDCPPIMVFPDSS